MSNGHTPFLMAAFVGRAERDRLLAAAAEDPRALSEIEASDRLRQAIESGRTFEEAEIDAALMTLALLESSRSDWAARLRRRIEGDSHTARKWSALAAKRHRLESGIPASEHFEKLTGHRGSESGGYRWAWLSAAAIVAVILLHGVWSVAAEDPVLREAWRGVDNQRVERGFEAETSALELARQEVRLSRSTTLYLWPRYDRSRLEVARSLIEQRADGDALLLDARIAILLGNPEQARADLRLIPTGGPQDVERRQLERLLEQASR